MAASSSPATLQTECEICNHPYDENKHCPHILPKCGHTFCITCIKSIMTCSVSCKKHTSLPHFHTTVCPLCFSPSIIDGTEQYPRNFLSMKLIEEAKAVTKRITDFRPSVIDRTDTDDKYLVYCTYCTTELAICGCEECTANYCATCWGIVHKVGLPATHKKVDISVKFKARCVHHPAQPLVYLCVDQDCPDQQKFMCTECFMELPHYGHKHAPIQAVSNLKRTLMKTTCSELQEKMNVEDTNLKTLFRVDAEDPSLMEEILAELEQQFSRVQQALTARKMHITAKLTELFMTKREHRDATRSRTEESLRLAKQLIDLTIDFAQGDDDIYVIEHFTERYNTIRGYLDHPLIPYTNPGIPTIQFDSKKLLEEITNFGFTSVPLRKGEVFCWKIGILGLANSTKKPVFTSPIWHTPDPNNHAWNVHLFVCPAQGKKSGHIRIVLNAHTLASKVKGPVWPRVITYQMVVMHQNPHGHHIVHKTKKPISFSHDHHAHSIYNLIPYPIPEQCVDVNNEMEIRIQINVLHVQ